MPMRFRKNCPQNGFSRLEFVLVVILFAMLLGVYLRATRHYQEIAEEATVSLTLSNIRVGMAQEWAERIAKARARDGIGELLGANPVRWLDSPPMPYLGEMKSPRIDNLAPGHWFFDLSSRELGYVVNVGDHLEIDDNSRRKILRWKVRLEDNSKSPQPDFGDLVLVPVSKYQWF